MRTVFDFSPYRRSTVGFDRLFDTLEAAARGDTGGTNYPPYDIERTGEDAYRITLAVAGFAEDEIELTAQQNLLVVAGKKAEVVEDEDLAVTARAGPDPDRRDRDRCCGSRAGSPRSRSRGCARLPSAWRWCPR